MAISTPAQKPRGAASSTLSTPTGGVAEEASTLTRSGYPRPAHRPLAGGCPAVGWSAVSAPRVVAVAPGSPAARAGLVVGDEILAIAGQIPRDVIEYRLLVDEPDVVLDVG